MQNRQSSYLFQLERNQDDVPEGGNMPFEDDDLFDSSNLNISSDVIDEENIEQSSCYVMCYKRRF